MPIMEMNTESRQRKLSLLVCPGCGKPYDLRVSTINARMFCDGCRLETIVVIQPKGYVRANGEDEQMDPTGGSSRERRNSRR